MSVVVSPVTAGQAHEALADAVQAAKAGKPLHPVVVIVPTNAVGVVARRRLGLLTGVAAVEFTTLRGAAEGLAAPAFRAEGRRAASSAVIDITVGKVLAESSSSFDAVAKHPSTITALRELHQEIRAAGPQSASDLQGSSHRGREAARVSTRVAERLVPDWYDEGDIFEQAIEALADQPPIPGLSQAILFLPQDATPLHIDFIRALAARGNLQILLGLTGESHADAELIRIFSSLGPFTHPARRAAVCPDTTVLSFTDADEEVRHAVRAIVKAARDGTPFARMAILWSSSRPYARLVEHHLQLAAIPWNGRPGTLVAERVVPRFLVDLLSLDRRGLRQRDLFDMLASLELRNNDGLRVPVGRWERVSREAGVVSGDHWGPRLRQWATRQHQRAEAAGGSTTDAEAAEALVDFVAQLRNDLGHPSATRLWNEWADWAMDQIDVRLGSAAINRLGEPELQAFDHTRRVLDDLRSLDAVSEPPTRLEFLAMFKSEFNVAPGRLGHIGDGVTVASLSGAAGLSIDFAIIVGAAEGSMPAAPPSDPLISDADRRASGLPTSDIASRTAHRHFLGVLSTADHVVITTPRGDLRATADRLPSRWLADIGVAAPRAIASHMSALAATAFPANAYEHRLRGRNLAVARSGPGAIDQFDDPVLKRGLRLRSARRSNGLTQFDGDLSSTAIPVIGAPVSPTQLEAWAACPHAYFMRYLLRVRALDDPGHDVSINALDRGNVVHQTLEQFHNEVISGELPQPTEHGWGEGHLDRLRELLVETSTRFERAGRTGHPAAWAVDRLRIENELLGWAESDSITSVARHSVVIGSEERFGVDSPVSIELPSGRSLAFIGIVDRIDRTASGTVVTDHKTGSIVDFKSISGDDPTAEGTRFQLPAYAAAVVAAGATEGDVRAEYAFLQRAKYQRVGYTFNEDVWHRVGHDLENVVSGIEAGWFPATPVDVGSEPFIRCHYCQPDALGTIEREQEWQLKQHDPRLQNWFGPPDEHGEAQT